MFLISIYLSLCQCYMVFHCSSFVIYFLNLGSMMHPALFLFLKIDLVICGSFVITYEFWNQIIFYFRKNTLECNRVKTTDILTPVRMDITKKNQRQHVLARMWRNCKPGTLFVGIQNDVDAMENRLFKTKNTIWSNNNTFWYLSKIKRN